MSNKTSLADQLGWCITTRDRLTELANAVQVSRSNVQNTLIAMAQSNDVPNEVVEFFKDTYQEFNDEADKMINNIQSQHISYINERADDLKKTIQVLLK